MTKKDYELIAGVLLQAKMNGDIMCIGIIARLLANEFKRKNERFNRSKFLEACGLEA